MSDRVLVLGGCGFIGRYVVHFLVTNQLASKIRVVDKVLPEMAHLDTVLKEAFQNPIVEFKQANLASKAHLPRAFQDESGPYNIVINLAAETKYGQSDEVYQAMITDLRVNCAQAALETGSVERYIEVSTAQVYEPNEKPSKEGSKIKPWTHPATFQATAEERVLSLGLPVSIIRLPIVYGPGDKGGLMPRILCAATYKHTQEKMKILWTGELKINTVHVRDVATAVWCVAKNGQPNEIYNVVDHGDTNQKKLHRILEEIFGIECSFVGSLMSNVAKLKLSEVAQEANEGHMEPWSEMCKAHNLNSVLSPYIDKELLYNNHLSIDGSKLASLGWNPAYPQVTKDNLLESIHYWIELKQFPPLDVQTSS